MQCNDRYICGVIILAIIFTLFSSRLSAETLFTLRAPESHNDTRYDYDNELFSLILEKTQAKYGKYKVVFSRAINRSRAQYSAISNSYENFFFKQSYTPELEDELIYAPFPVDLGIVGYRVCFTSQRAGAILAELSDAERLKGFAFGLGQGWTDVEILRYNGYKVIEKPSYESLFRMVAAGRFDLFCRGVNEILGEYNAYKRLDGLTLESKWVFFYPLPRFFYTNKQNHQQMVRVKEGLEIAYNDGSMMKLWNKYYQPSILFSKLNKREIVSLKNPYIENIDKQIYQYFYRPN